MARELVWLENRAFVAGAGRATGSSPTLPEKPRTRARDFPYITALVYAKSRYALAVLSYES